MNARIALVSVLSTFLVMGLWDRIARADLLKEGDLAPQITAQMVTGDQVAPFSLADYRGKKVILYFYPKDGTPGCTKEACEFRDGYQKFTNSGMAIFGCSIDTLQAHKDFIKKYNLPFPLLLDPSRSIAKTYGVVNGIPILGLDRRVTYVINEEGRIEKVYPRVDPASHSDTILAEIKPAATPVATPAMAKAPAPASSDETMDEDDDSADSDD